MWYAGHIIFQDNSEFGNVIKVFFILIISAIEPGDRDGEHAAKISGHIELKDVTFAYPSRPDVALFKALNLKFRSGGVPAGQARVR